MLEGGKGWLNHKQINLTFVRAAVSNKISGDRTMRRKENGRHSPRDHAGGEAWFSSCRRRITSAASQRARNGFRHLAGRDKMLSGEDNAPGGAKDLSDPMSSLAGQLPRGRPAGRDLLLGGIVCCEGVVFFAETFSNRPSYKGEIRDSRARESEQMPACHFVAKGPKEAAKPPLAGTAS
jgi:hypothetical protein